MNNALREAKEWGELTVVSRLIEAVYIRDKVLAHHGITPTGGKWMQDLENNVDKSDEEFEAAC